VQTADRPEFEAQVARLCAGYGQPVTKHREAAYWSGLAKMSLAQFSRCIDFALSDAGPDELPAVKGIWKIHRGFRAGPRPQPKADRDPRDHLVYWSNRLLYAHMAGRHGLGSINGEASAELEACRKLKRELIEWFTGPVRDGDPDTTPAEFLRQWIAGLQAISRIEKSVYDRWCAMMELPESNQPFEPYMGRPLEPEQRSLVPA
jgi:hypothetical protein